MEPSPSQAASCITSRPGRRYRECGTFRSLHRHCIDGNNCLDILETPSENLVRLGGRSCRRDASVGRSACPALRRSQRCQGGPSGDSCAWTPPVQQAQGVGLIVLLALVAVVAIGSMVFPRPWPLIAVSLGSATVWLVSANLNLQLSVWLSDLGLSLTSDMETKWLLILMLPSSTIWLLAGVAGLIGQTRSRCRSSLLNQAQSHTP